MNFNNTGCFLNFEQIETANFVKNADSGIL